MASGSLNSVSGPSHQMTHSANDVGSRGPKALLLASKGYVDEHRLFSWWCLISTSGLYVALVCVAVGTFPLPIRIACSLLSAFLQVRLFVIYHDYHHGTILKNSRLARCLMNTVGLLLLSPPSAWKRSHDHHHKYNSKLYGGNIGSYPLMTTDAYAESSTPERFAYAASRHPVTILFGYFTVFMWGMCLFPLTRNPRHHADAALSMLVHLSVMVVLAFFGTDAVLLGFAIPTFVATCFGAYLFYAQHNFPSAMLRAGDDWTCVDAALHSSSFMRMGPILNWLTGNIGYHHVHHLNARIPFYRLPEAMRGLPELQSPKTTTLSFRDIRACLRLKLWDPRLERLVAFDELTSRLQNVDHLAGKYSDQRAVGPKHQFRR